MMLRVCMYLWFSLVLLCVCPLGGESVLVVCFLFRDWSPAPVISWMFGIRGPSGQIWAGEVLRRLPVLLRCVLFFLYYFWLMSISYFFVINFLWSWVELCWLHCVAAAVVTHDVRHFCFEQIWPRLHLFD